MRIIRSLLYRISQARHSMAIKRGIRAKGGRVDSKVELTILGAFSYGRNVMLLDKGIAPGQGMKVTVLNGAALEIGDNAGISQTGITCAESIKIGKCVNVGAGCLIFDTDFHSLDWRDRSDHAADLANAKHAPVVIGDYAFIGARSIICKGVTIGERSIIGTGSVVAKSVPAGEIWAGNPARFIKKAP